MRKFLLPVPAILFLFYSCRRENIGSGTDTDPKLKRTVTRNTSDIVTRVSHYNDMELVIADTSFQNGSAVAFLLYEYNNKGKMTRSQTKVPAIYNSGFLWDDHFFYQDDTLLISKDHYLKGTQVGLYKYFYNASNKLVLDSLYHTGFTISTDVKRTTYDAQGRVSTEFTFNTTTDTTYYITYQYGVNHVEQFRTSYSYNPVAMISYSKTITDYTATGKILSEKIYAPLTQLTSQADYTYDGNDRLLKKITTNSSGIYEDRYFYNSYNRIERIEAYYQNNPGGIKTYYYE